MRKHQAEVKEKHLDERQRQGFQPAKMKEVKNCVVAEAFKALPAHMKPSRDQILKMRWLSTWKLDDNPQEGVEPLKRHASGNALRPKARAVVFWIHGSLRTALFVHVFVELAKVACYERA